jgi:hypothetical protein
MLLSDNPFLPAALPSKAASSASTPPQYVSLSPNVEFKSVKKLCDNRKGSFIEKIVLSATKNEEDSGRVEQICRVDLDTLSFGARDCGGPNLYSFSHGAPHARFHAYLYRIALVCSVGSSRFCVLALCCARQFPQTRSAICMWHTGARE